MATGTASDILQAMKEEQTKQAGVKKWEDIFLAPLQESSKLASEAVSRQTSYDISEAYANYKKAELGIMRNQRLASGFRNQLASELKSDYEKQYASARAEEASSLFDIASKYQTEATEQITSAEKTLTEQATKLKKLEDYLIEYSGADASKFTTSVEQGGLGYYAPVEGQPGTYELTDLGKDYFDKYLHSYVGEGDSKTLFSDYLRENDEELYDFYTQNKAAFNKYIGGLEETDMSYDAKDRWYGNETLVRDYVNNNYSFDDVNFGKNEEILNVLKEIQKDLGLENVYSDVRFEQKINETDAKVPIYLGGKYSRDISIKDIPARQKVVEQLVEEMVKEAAKRKHK